MIKLTFELPWLLRSLLHLLHLQYDRNGYFPNTVPENNQVSWKYPFKHLTEIASVEVFNVAVYFNRTTIKVVEISSTVLPSSSFPAPVSYNSDLDVSIQREKSCH